MVIECFGLPGAGKSTVAKRLAKTFNVPVVPMYVSKWYTVRTVLRHPWFSIQFLIRLLLHSHRTKTWRLFMFKQAVFQNTLGRLAWAQQQARKYECIFIDEGLVQRLLSLFETNVEKQNITSLLSGLPPSAAVVVIRYQGTDFTGSKVGEAMRSQQSAEYQAAWQAVIAHNFTTIAGMLHEYQTVIPYERTEADDRFDDLTQSIRALTA